MVPDYRPGQVEKAGMMAPGGYGGVCGSRLDIFLCALACCRHRSRGAGVGGYQGLPAPRGRSSNQLPAPPGIGTTWETALLHASAT